jgi:tetratricopeptide (TPR) repeat protein
VRKLVLLGAVTVLVVLLYGRSLVTSEGESPTPEGRDDGRAIVELSDAREASVDEKPSVYEVNVDGDDLPVIRARPITGGGQDKELAYEDSVELFIEFYRDTINEINPLVHTLLMHSRGDDQMTEAEVQDLNALLSEMEHAPEFGAIEFYPEGYEDCSRHLRTGGISLYLAADSIRGFNRTSDIEYLTDYQALIGMYLQAVSDARSCVAAHLYPAFKRASSRVYLARGKAYEEQEQPDKAIDAYERALEINPDLEPARKQLEKLRPRQ